MKPPQVCPLGSSAWPVNCGEAGSGVLCPYLTEVARHREMILTLAGASSLGQLRSFASGMGRELRCPAT